MEGEGVRSFKELRAKFQNLDAPPLPGPIKLPAGVSPNSDIGGKQSTQILANGKPLSSNHKQHPPHCSSSESRPLQPQKIKLAQKTEIPKYSSSPGPLGKSTVCSAASSQNTSLLLEVTQSNVEIITKEKVMVANSFRNKLWNWEKVSSQKSEMSSVLLLANCGSKAFHLEGQKGMGLTPEEPRKKLETKGAQTLPSQKHLVAPKILLNVSEDPSFVISHHIRKSWENPRPEKSPASSTYQPIYECELASQAPEKQSDVRHHHLPKMKPLPSINSLGPPPQKPSRPTVVNLQAFQRQRAAVPKTQGEVTVEEGSLPPERLFNAEFEEPHNYEATISYLRHSGNSINLCTAKEIADPTYEVGIEELQKSWKNFPYPEPSAKHEDKKMKEKEPCELEPKNTEKEPHSNHVFKVDAYEGTPEKIQMTNVHTGRRNMLAGKQEAMIDVIQTNPCPEGPKLARHSQGHCGYLEVLESTKETPDLGVSKPSSISEEIYDDVEYSRKEVPKPNFRSSFASNSEENREEMYEDVYKTKNNYPKIDLDGKEALKRLQQFFKKEKDRFKIKKTKSKENLSAFSILLPDLELKSQEVIIYDDVDLSEKESKDEDKLKMWKPKFLTPKEKKEKNGAEESESFSPRSFFKTKKQNLEKNRMKREEKLFRERFKYNKEIIVINTAVACSKNSRNGIFDLPISPGEELEVIDTTEQNLVICRNSKGKYGYVLIEHLDFKHQSWSP
ncbi:FYN-binding protein 2 isoform X5 [Macaca thibetana thibetana]|uniref:FYN-binding protein 2 isoform X5 n=1 Tax=Macaca thibetana thibetana TaxID=257877 RepID=UPI0021BC3A34|nr:FYN-binding protein 2 isoform X5 [Macaca thibetana thibetana]